MKKYVIGFVFAALFAQYSMGQHIVEDGKVSRREFRLKSKQMPPKERKTRLEDWKYERFIARQEAKNKRKNRKAYAKVHKRGPMPAFLSKKHRPQQPNNKGWFARTNPKKHEKATKYP